MSAEKVETGIARPRERCGYVKKTRVIAALAGAGAVTIAICVVATSRRVQKTWTPVDQLLSGKPALTGGKLIHGTLTKRENPCEYVFSLAGGTSPLVVHYAKCTAPEALRDMPPWVTWVAVEGHLRDDGWFEASSLKAKVPSYYQPTS
jgi:cytochrome c-type biogenesis protein CcmE